MLFRDLTGKEISKMIKERITQEYELDKETLDVSSIRKMPIFISPGPFEKRTAIEMQIRGLRKTPNERLLDTLVRVQEARGLAIIKQKAGKDWVEFRFSKTPRSKPA